MLINVENSKVLVEQKLKVARIQPYFTLLLLLTLFNEKIHMKMKDVWYRFL